MAFNQVVSRRQLLTTITGTGISAAIPVMTGRTISEQHTTPQQATPTTWRMMQADSAHTGYSPTSDPTDEGSTVWEVAFQDEREDEEDGIGPRGHAAVVDGTIYVPCWGSLAGYVLALSAVSGRERWRYENLDAFVSDGVAVQHDQVYVGIVAHRESNSPSAVLALDAASGEEQWRYAIDDEVGVTSPTLHDNTVYVGSENGNVYALDAETGTERWVFPTADSVTTPPAVGDGTVYAGSYDGHVYAIDAETGEERWKFDTAQRVFSSPTVHGSHVFVGSESFYLYALAAETGEEQWRLDTGGIVDISPAVHSGTVYLGTRIGTVTSLDAATGDTIWEFTPSADVEFGWSNPALTSNTLYIVGNTSQESSTEPSYLYAVDAASGEQRWSVRREYFCPFDPCLADGRLYHGTYSNPYAEDPDPNFMAFE